MRSTTSALSLTLVQRLSARHLLYARTYSQHEYNHHQNDKECLIEYFEEADLSVSVHLTNKQQNTSFSLFVLHKENARFNFTLYS